MLELAKKVEANLGDGITVTIGVLPLRKQQELEPLISKIVSTDKDESNDKLEVSITVIHDILTYFGNKVSRDLIGSILTTYMLQEILKIAYGKQE